MRRADKDLAFMLQYENIAWYEDGMVKILDRRVYPKEIVFVTCKTHVEVTQAITDMVTQSGGPYAAAGMGMALAAYECRNMPEKDMRKYLRKAAYTISNARPTTMNRMKAVTDGCLQAADLAIIEGKKVDEAIFLHTLETLNTKYDRVSKTASHLVDMFPQRGTIMTQCFGEIIVGQMLKEAKNRDMDIKVMVPETRPYFQGARLTASVVHDQGFEATVITDNMPAHIMKTQKIDLFTSAADAICLDGHIVNKVGSLQIAITANHFGVPYFVTGEPDKKHPTIDTVDIEYRDPEFVLQAMGVRTAMEGVKGIYPSFDATPPHLIAGIVTNRGIFSPYDIKDYYKD